MKKLRLQSFLSENYRVHSVSKKALPIFRKIATIVALFGSGAFTELGFCNVDEEQRPYAKLTSYKDVKNALEEENSGAIRAFADASVSDLPFVPHQEAKTEVFEAKSRKDYAHGVEEYSIVLPNAQSKIQKPGTNAGIVGNAKHQSMPYGLNTHGNNKTFAYDAKQQQKNLGMQVSIGYMNTNGSMSITPNGTIGTQIEKSKISSFITHGVSLDVNLDFSIGEMCSIVGMTGIDLLLSDNATMRKFQDAVMNSAANDNIRNGIKPAVDNLTNGLIGVALYRPKIGIGAKIFKEIGNIAVPYITLGTYYSYNVTPSAYWATDSSFRRNQTFMLKAGCDFNIKEMYQIGLSLKKTVAYNLSFEAANIQNNILTPANLASVKFNNDNLDPLTISIDFKANF